MVGESPPQIEVGVDIGGHFRSDNLILWVGFLIVWMPVEGKSQVPFIIERQAGGESLDGRTLKDKSRQRVPQLWIQVVVSQTNALVSILVRLCLHTGLWHLKGIFQASGEGMVHRSSLIVCPFEVRVGVQNGRWNNVPFQSVNGLLLHLQGVSILCMNTIGKKSNP